MIELRELTRQDAASFQEYAQDFEPENHNLSIKTIVDFERFIEYLRDFELGINLKPGYVNSKSYFLFDSSGLVVGRVTFRKDLNERTRIEGGHIGYEVRKSMRNQGIATKMVGYFLS